MYKEASSSAPSIRKKRFAGKNDSSAPSGRALSCAANRQKQPVLHREANHHRTVRGVPYPARPPLRREATLSGAKESWGVARGDRKPWCPIPFCPSPREGRVLHAAACKSPPAAGRRQPPRPGRGASCTPQRANPPCRRAAATPSPREGRVPARRSVRNSLPPKAAITIPPRAGFRLRRRTAVSAEVCRQQTVKTRPAPAFAPAREGIFPWEITPTSPRRPGSTRPSPDGRCAPPVFLSACRPQAASPSCPRRRRDTRARHSRGSFRR